MKIGDNKIITNDMFCIFPEGTIVEVLETDSGDGSTLVLSLTDGITKDWVITESLKDIPVDKRVRVVNHGRVSYHHKASTIVKYYRVYRQYLALNDFKEEGGEITVDQLVDFVENHILNG